MFSNHQKTFLYFTFIQALFSEFHFQMHEFKNDLFFLFYRVHWVYIVVDWCFHIAWTKHFRICWEEKRKKSRDREREQKWNITILFVWKYLIDFTEAFWMSTMCCCKWFQNAQLGNKILTKISKNKNYIEYT